MSNIFPGLLQKVKGDYSLNIIEHKWYQNQKGVGRASLLESEREDNSIPLIDIFYIISSQFDQKVCV